jgi:hypothetical protein
MLIDRWQVLEPHTFVRRKVKWVNCGGDFYVYWDSILGMHGVKQDLEIVQNYFMYQKDVCIAIKVKWQ